MSEQHDVPVETLEAKFEAMRREDAELDTDQSVGTRGIPAGCGTTGTTVPALIQIIAGINFSCISAI